jgi:indolepyruvate ferredoxin oxidoreductase beta subunit
MHHLDKKNILFCGLAGQGIGLISSILGDYYVKHGREVKVSNVMGLGQRGGNVECHFRYSSKQIMSPLIQSGTVDYLVSLELTETVRNLHFLKHDGVVISSTFEISTPTVNIGIQKDIHNKQTFINSTVKNTCFIDIEKYQHIGKVPYKMLNIVFLAFFMRFIEYENHYKHLLNSMLPTNYYSEIAASLTDIPDAKSVEVVDIMKAVLKPNLLLDNIKAYDLGRAIFEEYLAKVQYHRKEAIFKE